jgi:prephenate dehydrogenase
MKITIIGDFGNFGSFLKEELAPHAQIIPSSQETDAFILATPVDTYDSIAKELTSRFGNRTNLVNVCSVQEHTTETLWKYTRNVTSIHPLFGARSPKSPHDRISVVTQVCQSIVSNRIVDLFSKISQIKFIEAEIHDKAMSLTHVKVIQIAEQIKEIVDSAKDIPEYLITPSFKKMRELSEQFLDMSEGTKRSILSNPYVK